jgi:hypothetical protein
MNSYQLSNSSQDLSSLNLPMPTRWSRDDIKLFNRDHPLFVDLGMLKISDKTGTREFKAYVARYELAGAIVDGEARSKDDKGHFLVFYITEFFNSRLQVWTLSQTESPVFSDEQEKMDYLLADKIGKTGPTLTGKQPSWKKNEAIWPTIDGECMHFLDETNLLNTEINKKHATTGERIFWFHAVENDMLRFKAVTQRIKFQSADDHYASELR